MPHLLCVLKIVDEQKTLLEQNHVAIRCPNEDHLQCILMILKKLET